MHELLCQGVRDLIAKAVEAELATFLAQYADTTLEDGRQAVVRNGFLPERTVQTGIGDVTVKVPKRSGGKACFNSALLPPYLKRVRSVEELIPWLYLKGVSAGDYQEALSALLGAKAKGLSANTVSRLKAQWLDEHKAWCRRDLADRRYVYWWADGVYSNVRLDDRLCLLVIVGVTEHGRKELVAVEDGHRESEASWTELLTGLRERGLTEAPRLVIGDGALGFWKALSKVYPATVHQRCWVHKTANVLNKLPKSVQPKVKADLHEIWMAETREEAHQAFDRTLKRFGAKHRSPGKRSFSQPEICSGDHCSASFSATSCRNAGEVARWHTLGRLACSQAASSAVLARYWSRPPWRATSRLTVETERPNCWAIRRKDRPAAIPREIVSRSARVKCRLDRERGRGAIPPLVDNTRCTDPGF